MILRFEDIVAIKHKIHFYIGADSDLTIFHLKSGFILAVEYGKFPFKGNITFNELVYD